MAKPLIKPMAPENDAELQKLVEFYNETLGFCPNSVLTMYYRPEIAYAFINLNKAVMDCRGRVTASMKRLIAYLSSNATGCRYCQAHAIRAAERYGAEAEKLENIWDYKTHPSFDDAERAAFDFTIAASVIPNAVDDKVSENLRKYWDEGEITEITGVIALFGFLNRWNDSMATEIEEPAVQSAQKMLGKKDWEPGKHA